MSRARPGHGPVVLVAAGLDPTGGAGLLADAEALRAVGARAQAVATALTIQGPAGAFGYQAVSRSLFERQVEGLLAGRRDRPAAVKVGMLGSGEVARAMATFCRGRLSGLPLVVDPVLKASAGLPLLADARGRPAAVLLAPLFACATLITPNWPELEVLSGAAPGSLCREDDAVEAARSLGGRGVLVKGGHRRGAPVDLLVTGREVRRFEGRRRPFTARGTGCRLSSAIAGLLAAGATLPEAVRAAKRYVERYLDLEGRLRG